MQTRLPTAQEIDELIAFLPRLYRDGFAPVKQWHGGKRENGVISLPWPEYDEIVQAFFRVASGPAWSDTAYRPDEAGAMLADEAALKTADLAQIRTMLTYCVRGERFSDGHWAAMIEGGHIRRLLERLSEVRLGSI